MKMKSNLLNAVLMAKLSAYGGTMQGTNGPDIVLVDFAAQTTIG